jgi:hypothetical protein
MNQINSRIINKFTPEEIKNLLKANFADLNQKLQLSLNSLLSSENTVFRSKNDLVRVFEYEDY